MVFNCSVPWNSISIHSLYTTWRTCSIFTVHCFSTIPINRTRIKKKDGKALNINSVLRYSSHEFSYKSMLEWNRIIFHFREEIFLGSFFPPDLAEMFVKLLVCACGCVWVWKQSLKFIFFFSFFILAIYFDVFQPSPPTTSQTTETDILIRENKITMLVITLVVIFLICHIPNAVYSLYKSWQRYQKTFSDDMKIKNFILGKFHLHNASDDNTRQRRRRRQKFHLLIVIWVLYDVLWWQLKRWKF